MRDLIRILLDNPILLLILVGWLVSGIFGALSKAAKKAQQNQQRRPGRPVGGQPAATPRTMPPTPRRAPRDPAEIAREMRRMMGLETVVEEPRPAAPRERSLEGVADKGQERSVTTLKEELVTKRAETAARLSAETKVRRTHMHSDIPQTHVGGLLPHHLVSPRRRRSGARRSALRRPSFNPKKAVEAIIAMEVLGPPRAMRPYDLSRDR